MPRQLPLPRLVHEVARSSNHPRTWMSVHDQEAATVGGQSWLLIVCGCLLVLQVIPSLAQQAWRFRQEIKHAHREERLSLSASAVAAAPRWASPPHLRGSRPAGTRTLSVVGPAALSSSEAPQREEGRLELAHALQARFVISPGDDVEHQGSERELRGKRVAAGWLFTSQKRKVYDEDGRRGGAGSPNARPARIPATTGTRMCAARAWRASSASRCDPESRGARLPWVRALERSRRGQLRRLAEQHQCDIAPARDPRAVTAAEGTADHHRQARERHAVVPGGTVERPV